MKTIFSVYKESQKLFKQKKFNNPGFLSSFLISEVLQIKPFEIFINKEKYLSDSIIKKIKYALFQRISGVPFEYIFGHKNFYGFDFSINKNVLIPRYETELLCAAVIDDFIGNKNKLKVYDFFTGSGIIPIVLKKYLPDFEIAGFDISKRAISIARKNAKKNKVKIKFHNINCTGEDILIFNKADIITANPPYIETDKITGELKKEPRIALNGGKDGLSIYKKMLPIIKKLLKKNGYLYFEIGFKQDKKIIKILENEGFELFYIKKDYNSIPRIIKAKNI